MSLHFTSLHVMNIAYLPVHEEYEVGVPHFAVLVRVQSVHEVLDLPPDEVLVWACHVRGVRCEVLVVTT